MSDRVNIESMIDGEGWLSVKSCSSICGTIITKEDARIIIEQINEAFGMNYYENNIKEKLNKKRKLISLVE